jgi:hypothetical protein
MHPVYPGTLTDLFGSSSSSPGGLLGRNSLSTIDKTDS